MLDNRHYWQRRKTYPGERKKKKTIKKERKKLQNLCKTWNHFSDNEAEWIKVTDVEKLCDHLELASLQCLNGTITSSTEEVGEAARGKNGRKN